MSPVGVQLSVALASPVALGALSSSQLKVKSAGQSKIGALSSITVIICSQVDSLPHSSTAVHTLMKLPAVPPQSLKLPPF